MNKSGEYDSGAKEHKQVVHLFLNPFKSLLSLAESENSEFLADGRASR